MKRRMTLIAVIALVVIALFFWSPWINGSYVKERAVAEFERARLNVADDCGFACHGCGAAAWKKIPFGAQVTLEFACGMSPTDTSTQHRQAVVYVSPLG